MQFVHARHNRVHPWAYPRRFPPPVITALAARRTARTAVCDLNEGSPVQHLAIVASPLSPFVILARKGRA
eukprot:2067141-Prymnesium_polylepis.1